MAMKKKPGRSKVEVGIPSTEAVFSAGNNNASGSLIANLATQNRAELAYELITRPDYPSYGNFVTRGLTALPEDFLREGQRPNSLNHHFFGDISAWFIEYIAGIRVNPAGNDCREVRVTPNFIARLDFAEGHYDTVGGRVAVRWERDGSDIALTVECADGVHGEIRLPNGCRFKQSQLSFAELESGRYEICLLYTSPSPRDRG